MRIQALLRVAGVLLVLSLTNATRGEITEEGRARYTPWSGYWWPHAQGQLLVPLAKYDQLTNKSAAKWEREHHPPGQNIPKWHGYCHAWSASSLMEAEPVKPVQAGQAPRPLSLGVGDQKGLLAASHGQDVANSYGDRFGDRQGSEDRQDLPPDQLWHLLKLYVKQEGVPLVLDTEAAAEVWNYPIYAYRVSYVPQGTDGQHLAQMTIWMADDAVKPDFVGIKVRRQTYHFTFKLRNSAVVMGSGKWTGPSVKDHPDFAWYPYVAVPENPEIDYLTIRKLLGLSQVARTEAPAVNPNAPLLVESGTAPPTTPSSPSPATPPASTSAIPPAAIPTPNTTADNAANRPNNPAPIATTDPDNPPPPPSATNPQPQPNRPPVATTPIRPPRLGTTAPAPTPPAIQPSPASPSPSNTATPPANAPPAPPIPSTTTAPATFAGRVIVLSPWELVALIANKTSSFAFDATVDRFDGGQYAIGDSFAVRVSSEQEGYLYLLYITSEGTLSLLYPQPGQPYRVTPQNAFVIPGPKEDWVFRAEGPAGQVRIKAVVTGRPLVLSGLLPPGLDEQQHLAGGQGQNPEHKPAPRPARVLPLQSFRWHPTQLEMIQQLLLGYQQSQSIAASEYGSIKPQDVLGPFAQDEIAFYVGPGVPGTAAQQSSQKK